MALKFRYIQDHQIKLYYPDNQREELFPSLLKQGSVDKLARLAIPTLSSKKFTITTCENLAAGGEIVSALTIEGSAKVNTKSQILPDLKDDTSTSYRDLVFGIKKGDPDSEIKSLTLQALNNTNNVALVTLGSFNKGVHQVQIGLGIQNEKNNIFKSIILTDQEYYSSIEKLEYKNISLSSQKQFVADRALRLLLSVLNIKHEDIQFEPQIPSTILSNMMGDTIKNLSKYLGGLKIALNESCTGGFIAKTLTDFSTDIDSNYNSAPLLEVGQVLYNLEEKILDGVPEAILVQDDLYGRDTAAALARAIFKKNPTDISIGVTGLLNTPDTRPGYENKKPGDVYYSIIIPGYRAITEKVSLPIRSRLEMKADLTLRIFQRLLLALVNNEVTKLMKK